MSEQRTRGRFGLSHCLGTLVVLLLGGLLIIAIQWLRAREARIGSENNLKQILLAVHSHCDNQGCLPAARPEQNVSALNELIPYVEQSAFHRDWGKTKSVDDPANAGARAYVIEVFLSPRDSRKEVVPGWAPTNYLLNVGTKATLRDNNGPFSVGDPVTLEEIEKQDGASTTIAVVETLMGDGGTNAVNLQRQHVYLPVERLQGLKAEAGVTEWQRGVSVVGRRGAGWMDARFLQSTVNAGRLPNSAKPDVSCGGLGGWAGPRSFGGYVIVGMCDGSTRAVDNHVSW